MVLGRLRRLGRRVSRRSGGVLRRAARDGEIHPLPEKVGRTYYVREDARRITGAPESLVDRLRAA